MRTRNGVWEISIGRGRGSRRILSWRICGFNLSAAKGEQNAIVLRELVARLMTREQIAEAQKLARDWKPRHRRKTKVRSLVLLRRAGRQDGIATSRDRKKQKGYPGVVRNSRPLA